MATEEQPNPPKAEAPPSTATPHAVVAATTENKAPTLAPADTFSLDDLDKIIEAEDPDFKNQIEALKNQKFEASEGLQSLGVSTDDEHLTKDEYESESKREKILKVFLTPIRRAKTFFKMQAVSAKNRTLMFWEMLKVFARSARQQFPERMRFYWSQIKAAAVAVKTIVSRFMALSRKQKLAIGFMTLSAVLSIFVLSKTITGHWLPRYEDNMPRSLAKGSAFLRAVEKKEDLQDLFLAFPEVEYHVLLKKVVVNLRPTVNTGANPMGTFELYIGVDSQDTAVEVKDREKEMVDIIQRSIESFSYDDLTNVVGKTRMKEVVRDHINRVLNQGRVFHVYFNTFVIYNGA